MDLVPRWFEMLKELRNGTISYIQLIKREQVRPPVRPVCRRLGVAKLSDIVSEEILYRAIVQVADAQCRSPRREDNNMGGGGGGMGGGDYGGGDYGGGMRGHHSHRGIDMDDISMSSHSRSSGGGGMYMGGGMGDRRGMSHSMDGLPSHRNHHHHGGKNHNMGDPYGNNSGGGGMGMSMSQVDPLTCHSTFDYILEHTLEYVCFF